MAKVQQVSMGTQLNLQNLVQGSRSSKKQRMKAKQRMQGDQQENDNPNNIARFRPTEMMINDRFTQGSTLSQKAVNNMRKVRM